MGTTHHQYQPPISIPGGHQTFRIPTRIVKNLDHTTNCYWIIRPHFRPSEQPLPSLPSVQRQCHPGAPRPHASLHQRLLLHTRPLVIIHPIHRIIACLHVTILWNPGHCNSLRQRRRYPVLNLCPPQRQNNHPHEAVAPHQQATFTPSSLTMMHRLQRRHHSPSTPHPLFPLVARPLRQYLGPDLNHAPLSPPQSSFHQFRQITN